MAFSLLVVFLYGSMVWGIFPLEQSISWESHLFGMVAGLICAYVYKKEGPQRREHIWIEEEIPEHEYSEDEPATDEKIEGKNDAEIQKNEIIIKYNYIEKDDDKKE